MLDRVGALQDGNGNWASLQLQATKKIHKDMLRAFSGGRCRIVENGKHLTLMIDAPKRPVKAA